MTRRAKVFWQGEQVGTLEVPDSFRPPIAQADLDRIPATMIGRSRSWLYDVRPGDLRLELRGEGRAEEVVVIASHRIGSGDVGCLVGFEATADVCRPDTIMIELADKVFRDLGEKSPR